MRLLPAIRSMRLRTLPLSLAGVVCGTLLAVAGGHAVGGATVALLMFTTVCLQVLSNLSNELGDYLSGTDGDERQGPQYSVAQGALTERGLRGLIHLFVVLCLVSGGLMTWAAFGTLWALEPVAVLLLGGAAVWAAVHYTLGTNPYGYRGWGDLFVFIFFGLVSTLGGYYVVSTALPPMAVMLPAAAIGFFSIGVLNVNNIRDMATDAGTRMTIPLRIGERRAKIYHTCLIAAGWLSLLAYSFIMPTRCCWVAYLYCIMLPVYVVHVRGVWRHTARALDPMLPMLVIATFLLSILLGVGQIVASV